MRDANLRLERESDDLAQELITSKISLRAELDAAEEKADSYFKELQSLKRLYKETEEDRTQVQNEAIKVGDKRDSDHGRVRSSGRYISIPYVLSNPIKVKEMLQREVQRAEEEGRRNQSIISDYKQICSQLGRRLEEEQTRAKDFWQQWSTTLSDCPNCCAVVEDLSNLIASEHSSPDQSVTGSVVIDTKPPRSPTSVASPYELQVCMPLASFFVNALSVSHSLLALNGSIVSLHLLIIILWSGAVSRALSVARSNSLLLPLD